MKVCFETFGCRLNRAEALDDEAKFLARGWTLTEKHSDADLIVIRGCSVTARAQHDCERLIGHIRRKYPLKRLVLTGCLAARNENFKLRETDAKSVPASAVPVRTARAYLKVQDGCSGKCTFCIVPKFRGTSRSEPFNEVLAKAKRFIDAGYREIVVTGCNLSLYASSGVRLDGLVAALAEIDPSCRVRLGSLEPSPVAEKVLEVMEAHENICRFLHIPIQSCSPGVLTMMKRPYTMRDVEKLVSGAERRFPLISIGCDLIAGFPGESELDHLATRSFLQRHRFTNAHVFPYSERPGTPAENFPGALAREIRKARARELAAVIENRRAEFARSFIGRIVEAVIEDEKECAGWTAEYLWCKCKGGRTKRKGVQRVKVISNENHVLIGSPI
jgi:threonylcarbamoyladenosine tRNA methylthiotransferase MtaB